MLVSAVLLVALCLSTSGCLLAMGIAAVDMGVNIYKAGSSDDTQTQKEKRYYDAAIHRYYIIDESGRRQYQ